MLSLIDNVGLESNSVFSIHYLTKLLLTRAFTNIYCKNQKLSQAILSKETAKQLKKHENKNKLKKRKLLKARWILKIKSLLKISCSALFVKTFLTAFFN